MQLVPWKISIETQHHRVCFECIPEPHLASTEFQIPVTSPFSIRWEANSFSKFFEICLKLLNTFWLIFSLFFMFQIFIFQRACHRNFRETGKNWEQTWANTFDLFRSFSPPSLLGLKT